MLAQYRSAVDQRLIAEGWHWSAINDKRIQYLIARSKHKWNGAFKALMVIEIDDALKTRRDSIVIRPYKGYPHT